MTSMYCPPDWMTVTMPSVSLRMSVWALLSSFSLKRRRVTQWVSEMVFDVVGQRVLQGHALPGALDGKVQMVRQDKGEVGVQLTVQLVPGLLRNVVGRQHQRFGQVGQQVDVPLADVVERALDAVQIVQLVGHGGEAHPLAEHNQLIAPAVP